MRRALRLACWITIAAIACGTCWAEESMLASESLIESPYYNEQRVRRQIISRIRDGVYRDYVVDLCIEAPSSCNLDVFQKFKRVKNGKTSYSVKLTDGLWQELDPVVKEAIVREIEYYTWGHKSGPSAPLHVWTQNKKDESPLARLSATTRATYLHFAKPAYLLGGKGSRAYGPNCWYTSIAAIADADCVYAKTRDLASGGWSNPRFMGPTEFRKHMDQFDEVTEPEFGDIVRYYTDKPIYKGLAFGGEVHAAVYVGKEVATDGAGKRRARTIVLTKNGRRDMNFLMFQHLSALDKLYVSGGRDAEPRVKRGFFRVKSGAKLLDPATHEEAPAVDGYMIDVHNYHRRWGCLAGRIRPPAGKSCYAFPQKWRVLEARK